MFLCRKRKFQSTLPLRGVTGVDHAVPDVGKISIHTPLAGSDKASHPQARTHTAFQSTLPLRGVTRPELRVRRQQQISIHTPLAGSDEWYLTIR